jgi:outer membrane protein insertion porin family
MTSFRITFLIGLSLFLMLLFSVDVQAQQCDGTKPIVAMEVAGNVTYNQLTILKASGLEIGMMCSADAVRDAVLRLYHLNLFSEILVEVDNAGSGVKLTVRVREKPRLGSVEVQGNRHVKTEEIVEKLSLSSGQLYDGHRRHADIQAVTDIYSEKGYLNAKVSPRIEKMNSVESARLFYDIEEHEKVKIRGIYFTDNHAFTDKRLLKLMRTKPKKWYRSGDFHRDHFEEDLEKIKTFYRNNGYIDVKIDGYLFHYDEAARSMYIEIVLGEGDRYRLGTVRWEGNEQIEDGEIERLARFKEGSIYNHGKVDECVTNIYLQYSEIGYIFADIQPKKSVSDHTIDVNIDIVENFPAHVDRITIEGNTKTKEKVIRRELVIYPGDIFKRSRIVRSQQSVFNLGFFEDVQMETPPGDERGELDLNFVVKEKFTGQFNTAIGYSPIDKFTGTLGVSHPNIFGNGQRIDFNWEFGKYTQNLVIGFTEPWLLDTPTLFGIDLYHRSRNLRDYEEKRVGGALRLARPVPGVAFTKVYTTFRAEDVEIWYDDDTSYSYATYYPEGKRRTISSRWTAVRDSRDNIFFTNQGSLSNFTMEFAGGLLGGEVNYHKYEVSTKWFMPTFWKFSLMIGAEGGIIDGYTSPSEVPLYEKFFMGGVWEVPLRGYPDRSIGPMDELGRALGGRALVKTSLEYLFPIVPNQISGLLFFDAGNIWENLVEVDPAALKKGAGLGIRIQVPMIGMLGFDYAYGFDRPGGGAWEPHFQFGSTFY